MADTQHKHAIWPAVAGAAAAIAPKILPWIADYAAPAAVDYLANDQVARAGNALGRSVEQDVNSGQVGGGTVAKAIGQDAIEHGVARPVTTAGVGMVGQAVAKRLPGDFMSRVAQTSAPGALFSFRDLKTMGPWAGTMAKGLGAGVVTAGTNALNRVIGGPGSAGTPIDKVDVDGFDGLLRGPRQVLAGAIGGAPLGPWGVVSGAVLNPAQEMLAVKRDTWRNNDIAADTAAFRKQMPSAIAQANSKNVTAENENVFGRNIGLATAAGVGLAGIGMIVKGWMDRRRKKQEAMNQQVPKFAAWVWKDDAGGAQANPAAVTPPAPTASPMASPTTPTPAQPSQPPPAPVPGAAPTQPAAPTTSPTSPTMPPAGQAMTPPLPGMVAPPAIAPIQQPAKESKTRLGTIGGPKVSPPSQKAFQSSSTYYSKSGSLPAMLWVYPQN